MRPVAARGRRLWGLAGLATAALLAIPGGWIITSAGVATQSVPVTVTRVVTVRQPVTTLMVQSNGAPVQVTAGPVRRVRVTETISYNPEGGSPAVPSAVSDGILSLTGPQCDCSVSFTVTVPPGLGVSADTEGGALTVSGAAGANLNSGGGPVRATGISGHLIVNADHGTVVINGLTGPLDADTGGGALLASGVEAPAVTVVTSGGRARIGFTAPPDAVFVSTGGGPASLTVPGGPYALTASTYGGSKAVGIASSPAAGRSITVTTGGGPLRIEPPA
ncbi:MAG TPA: hypothetical protein VMF87_20650 [Streptosporangiaceae bacterium]|nr:hypothetical protein [Streptosporangiaceae bacterium]